MRKSRARELRLSFVAGQPAGETCGAPASVRQEWLVCQFVHQEESLTGEPAPRAPV